MTDPLGLLIDRLPIRRGKSRVRDKIVELGLVEDVKELRKKKVRSGKSAERKESNRDDSNDEDGILREGPGALTDSESDEENDSEEEDESEGESFKNMEQKKPKVNRPKQYGFAMKKTDYFSPEMLAVQLRQLVDDGA